MSDADIPSREVNMKKLVLTALCALSIAAVAGTADASGGCGRGYHRGPYGHCRVDRGAVAVAPGLVIGNFYAGQGYWDGHRYWHHRDRWHGGWRYR